jgi:hypothetical protein
MPVISNVNALMTAMPKLKVATVGAVWFALAAGLCFPLAMATWGPYTGVTLSQTGQGVLGGLQLFGPPAAIAGFLLANRAVSANVPGSFVIGALIAALACILYGFLSVLVLGKFHSLQRAVTDALINGIGLLVLSAVSKGVPFIVGGIASLAFRAFALRQGSTDK